MTGFSFFDTNPNNPPPPNNMDELKQPARRLPAPPQKPERRNVGKSANASTTTATQPALKGRRSGAPSRSISFSDKVDSKEVPKLLRSQSADFFWDDEELANFRNEAFMESCGLDPADFEEEYD
jgi:hypothetical protein